MTNKDKDAESSQGGTTFASSNWLALQKTLKKSRPTSSSQNSTSRPKKRRKTDTDEPIPSTSSSSKPSSNSHTKPSKSDPGETKNGESIPALRDMIAGKVDFSENQKLPGKYLSLDCEMVGIGLDGAESSLARVSLVNFHGYIILDEFVKQKERVVDWRTRYSGIREKDMIKAKPFEEVQKLVAELIKDRVLVGHAVFNDLKALLLNHPRHLTRDTQHLAGKYKTVKSKYVALRNLVSQEVGVGIQGGEHDSVTDARATMAVFRIHRKEWEKGFKHVAPPPTASSKAAGKRKRADGDEDEDEEEEDAEPTTATTTKKKPKPQQEFPGGGRKGVSSGLSVIVRGGKGGPGPSRSKAADGGGGKEKKKKWWKELAGSGTGGAKGTIRV